MESDLICQFSLAGLTVDEHLPARIRDGLCNSVEKEKISAVQLRPRKWARTAVIKCVDIGTKEKLLSDGITIGDKKIDLLDGGSGSMRISVDDAPLDMPNSVIGDALSQYGDVTGSRDQAFYVGDERTEWSSGTRLFFMKRVKSAIPPTMDIVFEGYSEKICIRYDGQSLYECRFCKKHVERGSHSCDQKPVKKCFNCLATDHMNFQCPNAKLCRKCSSPGHIARDCKSNINTRGQNGRRPTNITLGQLPIAPPRKRRKKRNASQMNNTGSPSAESIIDQAVLNIQESQETPVVKAVLIGDSNTNELPLGGVHSDDSMVLDITKHARGGLKVGGAHTMFADLPGDINLGQIPAVITHVGACDFPIEDDGDIDKLYCEYVEFLGTINRRCVNARVFISGIPPRRGYLNCKVNRDIATMNAKLEGLANTDDGLSFINSMVFLADDNATIDGLYSTRPTDDIHLSTEGKSRIASAMFDQIRNDLTKSTSESEPEEWAVRV